MVSVQVRTDGRMDARGAFALLAHFLALAPHFVHVGARPAKVAQVALEVGHLGNGFHFP